MLGISFPFSRDSLSRLSIVHLVSNWSCTGIGRGIVIRWRRRARATTSFVVLGIWSGQRVNLNKPDDSGRAWAGPGADGSVG